MTESRPARKSQPAAIGAVVAAVVTLVMVIVYAVLTGTSANPTLDGAIVAMVVVACGIVVGGLFGPFAIRAPRVEAAAAGAVAAVCWYWMAALSLLLAAMIDPRIARGPDGTPLTAWPVAWLVPGVIMVFVGSLPILTAAGVIWAAIVRLVLGAAVGPELSTHG